MRAMTFALAVAMALSAGAVAQEAPKPTVTKEFNGWTLRCFDQGGAQRCRIDEFLVNKKTGERVLGITVQYIAEQKTSLMEVGVPLGVAFENGAVINTDTYKSQTLRYRLCNQQGCFVILPVDPALAGKLGKATKASVDVVFFGGTGRKAALAFPLDGFTSAYQAMVESSSGKVAAAPATEEPKK